MWTLEDAVNNSTNKVVVPRDGIITISKPDTARVNAYVNDAEIPTQQVAVKAGDTVYFKLTNYNEGETPIGFMYEDINDVVMLPGKPETSDMIKNPEKVIKDYGDRVLGELNKQAEQARNYYEKLATQVKQAVGNTALSTTSTGETKMAEVMTPGMIMGMGGSGGGDGLFGGGGGGGLIGGLILGSLLRQGNGGLFGGGAEGGAAGAALRSPPEQVAANMALMQAIGQVDKSVAVSTSAMEASQATQTLGLTTQLNNVASSLASRTDNLKDVVNQNAVALMQGQAAINQNIMENRYELSKDISADGEKTRALIISQYEINLQRQLSDANAAIIELRSDGRYAERSRGVEVNTTTTVNQMQQQQQQQAQYGQLANLIYSLGQSIQNNNAAINVGSGTQTSTPTNTNTNIR